MLNIYKLTRAKCGYDELTAAVVCASCPEDARHWASTVCGDEGRKPWLTTANVEQVGGAAVGLSPGILCVNFHAG
jgi:hypothetical protein